MRVHNRINVLQLFEDTSVMMLLAFFPQRLYGQWVGGYLLSYRPVFCIRESHQQASSLSVLHQIQEIY